MFSVFGSERLDRIEDNAKGSDLTAWKNLPNTKWCRRNLFKTMRDGNTTFMDAIRRAVWKPEDQTNNNNAYAYAICDAILDPAILEMRMTEAIITPRLDPNHRSSVEQLLENKAAAGENAPKVELENEQSDGDTSEASENQQSDGSIS